MAYTEERNMVSQGVAVQSVSLATVVVAPLCSAFVHYLHPGLTLAWFIAAAYFTVIEGRHFLRLHPDARPWLRLPWKSRDDSANSEAVVKARTSALLDWEQLLLKLVPTVSIAWGAVSTAWNLRLPVTCGVSIAFALLAWYSTP